jgi:hypothetical protein
VSVLGRVERGQTNAFQQQLLHLNAHLLEQDDCGEDLAVHDDTCGATSRQESHLVGLGRRVDQEDGPDYFAGSHPDQQSGSVLLAAAHAR